MHKFKSIMHMDNVARKEQSVESLLQSTPLLVCTVFVLASATACSGKDSNEPRAVNAAPIKEQYDALALTEVRELSGFPPQLTHILRDVRKPDGVPAIDIVDPGEEFTPTDVVSFPSKRLLLGGISATSALVVYEARGMAPQYFADAYVHDQAGWALVARWPVEWAPTLNGIQIQTTGKRPR